MDSSAIQPFISRLSRHTELTEEEEEVLRSLHGSRGTVQAKETIVRRESVTKSCSIVVNGLAARTNMSKEGACQITGFYVPGDMPDLRTLMIPTTNFGVYALCDTQIFKVPHDGLLKAMRNFPAIAEAFLREMVRESDIAAQWMTNLGIRSGTGRVAHLLCEMAVKLDRAREQNTRFAFPVSQIVLAEAVGMSPVHVNRCLRSLREDNLLRFECGTVDIPSWNALVAVVGFDPGYLSPEKPLRFTN